MTTSLRTAFLGELIGTFLLVFCGCGCVAAAVAFGAQVGLLQVAMVWGFGVCVAILLTANASGAHINPAMTLAFALWRDFAWSRVLPYWLAQFIGAFAAAALIYALFGGGIALFETQNGIERGGPGSEASAMIFGEFFPNPGGAPLTEEARQNVTFLQAWLAEFVGTGLLAFAVFGFTDSSNKAILPRYAPFAIGAALTVLISLLAPLSMGGFNPARDLAPRIFSALAGWGDLPFSLNGHGWLTVYVIAPLLGAAAGGFLQRSLLSQARR